MPPLLDTDIVFYKSGVTGDCLGGVIHVDTISLSQVHNIFNTVSSAERRDGRTKFRCVYMKNTNSGIAALNPKLFAPSNTGSSTTEIAFAFERTPDSGGVGNGSSSGIAQTILNENTAPTGVVFNDETEVSKGAALGADIGPNQTIPVWIRLIVKAGTEKSLLDGCDIVTEFGNEREEYADQQEGEEEPGGGDTNIPIFGESDINEFLKELMKRIKLRINTNQVIFTGNTTSTTDPSAWINMLGFLKDRTSISFGPQDAKTFTMKNKLITALSTNNNSKGLGYSFQKINNMYIIYMDVTQPFINPSAQYDFVLRHLDIARGLSSVDFIIVVCNKSFYATLASNDANAKIDNNLRLTYHKIFQEKGVHLVIGGQFRNYQRQKVLSWNESAPDSPGTYVTGEPNYVIPAGQKHFGPTIGCLFVGVGTAGMRPVHIPEQPLKSYTSVAIAMTNTESVGYLMLRATKRKTTPTPESPKLSGYFYEYYRPNILNSIFGFSNSILFGSTKQEVIRDQFSITVT